MLKRLGRCCACSGSRKINISRGGGVGYSDSDWPKSGAEQDKIEYKKGLCGRERAKWRTIYFLEHGGVFGAGERFACG
jgi:hypothetical protein